MPPKRKKSAPVVVGTVSTRSTRRESIVNIEIIPKTTKSIKSSSSKKICKTATKTAAVTAVSCEPENVTETSSSEKTHPEILDILKDWSDDEYSQENNFILVRPTSKPSTQLADDQQSLIDILEGKQSDSQDVPTFQKTEFKTSNTSALSKLTTKVRGSLIDNPVINIDSPKVEDPDIIEECVVEDDSIIIVLPEEQTDESESNSNVGEKNNILSIGKDGSCLGSCATISKKSSENCIQALSITSEADGDIGSGTSSEDTFQSMVTVQGDYIPDNNIYISNSPENSAISSYEIVEEQVVCDSSEPIIIDNMDTTESNSNGSVNYLNKGDNQVNEFSGIALYQPTKSNLLEDSVQNSSNVVIADCPKDISESDLLSGSGNDLISTLRLPPHLRAKNVKPLTDEGDIIKSDDNSLCLKLNEAMQISNDSDERSLIDSTSDKLQEGISKMSIKNEEIYGESAASNSSCVQKNTQNMSGNLDSEKINFNKMESNVPPKNTKIRNLFDSDSNISPKISPRASPKFKIHSRATGELGCKYVKVRGKQYSQLTVVPLPQKKKVDSLIRIGSGHAFEYGDRSLQKASNTKFDMTLEEMEGTKILKAKSKKEQSSLVFVGNKMDIESESSETKTSETEGDSTSNDSNQDTTNDKTCEALKKVFELVTLESSLTPDVSGCEKESIYKKSPKIAKLKVKKENITEIGQKADKMDVEYLSVQQDSIKLLRSNIDATIDDVLRKYTCENTDTNKDTLLLKELNIPKEHKSRYSKDSKRKKETKHKKDEKNGESSEEVRRSDRIKTILPVKKKSHGLVRSKSEPLLSVEAENSDSSSVCNDSDKPTPSASPLLSKIEKTRVKSKSSDNLQIVNLPQPSVNSPELPKPIDMKADKSSQSEIAARLKTFAHLRENHYKTDRQVCKEARGMICDCYLAEEDIQKDEYGCGEDCLNRLLMIECGELCQVGHRCTNTRFQKSLFAPVEVFKTEKKGLGLRAAANIAYGEFILEYVGEVLNPDEFDKRAEVYSKDKNIHFYFMSLRADAIIDATMKGNISRFINHSCDPNAETQKWTVNGELRIGFFSTRTILAGEEITFDYRFQRYGKEAQKCYCEAATCRGWLGERPDESEDDEEEEEDDTSKVQVGAIKADIDQSPVILKQQSAEELIGPQKSLGPDKTNIIDTGGVTDITTPVKATAGSDLQELPKKSTKKKLRKEVLFEDFDQLNEDIEMLVTTGLKNQAHTLKLSRLMVRAKYLNQRKKLLRVLRRGELPCRRLFLDYHGLRLMHGYMIDAQQLTSDDVKPPSSEPEVIQTKLELLQTLAVLPIQNKTMLIESKVLPAVEKWAKNEDLVEDVDQRDFKKMSPEVMASGMDTLDPTIKEKIDEIKFLATKLLEEWVNLKESFRIPKKQRIEQMKEHEKEANRKFIESSSYSQEKESSRKHEPRYRSWSRYKSERETGKKSSRHDDRPSAEFLKISRHERRKLFALQMELKEEERRLKQRELWRQHEMNCMLIGTDPRFTAPFDPNKGFQYIWNPSLGQWQALPFPATQAQGVYNSPQGVSSYNLQSTHKQPLLGSYATGISATASQYPGLQQALPPMVPGLATSAPGMVNPVHGLPGSITGIATSLPGITQHSLSTLPIYPEVKQDDPSQVKFAGPIPPPAKLPPKWKCAKDKYGRPYYYHVKIRKSQWEPPPLSKSVEEFSESSSSETSSGSSSDDSSSNSGTDDEIDDIKLLSEVRKQMESTSKINLKSIIPDHIKKEIDSVTPSPEVKLESDNEDELNLPVKEESTPGHLSSIDIRLKEQFNLDGSDPPKKKRRLGLCQEIIIAPRTAQDRKQFKEDYKKYKATKEKLKRQKEQMLIQVKKKQKTSTDDVVRKSRDKRSKNALKSRIKELKEWNDENARRIKELFRSTMANTVVSVLNAYRKPDCREAKITNTDDFKHLARKLTHFVMLKEMKHLSSIDELICTDNVKAKAREYIRKYMSKFGEVYQKRHDEPDFKD